MQSRKQQPRAHRFRLPDCGIVAAKTDSTTHQCNTEEPIRHENTSGVARVAATQVDEDAVHELWQVSNRHHSYAQNLQLDAHSTSNPRNPALGGIREDEHAG